MSTTGDGATSVTSNSTGVCTVRGFVANIGGAFVAAALYLILLVLGAGLV